MRLSKKVHYLFLAYVLSLSLLFRYLPLPHYFYEEGTDTFIFHWQARGLLQYGEYKLALTNLGLIGLQPFSYTSGIVFVLASFSQITGINVEISILLLSLFYCFLGITSVFCLAKAFSKNSYFPLFVVFAFALSYYFIRWTEWRTSPRGLFMVLVPLFVCCLIRTNERNNRSKNIFLLLLLYFSLVSVHRMSVLILPVIVIPFIITKLLSLAQKNPRILKLSYNKLYNRFSFGIFSFMCISFIILSLYRPDIIEAYSGLRFVSTWIGALYSFDQFGSFNIFVNWAISYTLHVNILLIFGVIGLVVLASDSQRRFNETYILAVTIPSFLLSSNIQYTLPVLLPIISLFIACGFVFYLNLKIDRKTKMAVLCASLLITTFSSGYIYFLNSPQTESPSPEKFKGDADRTYNTALWSNYNTKDGRSIFNFDNHRGKIIARSDISTMFDPDLAYSYPQNFRLEPYSWFDMLTYHREYYYGGKVYTNNILHGEYQPGGYKWLVHHEYGTGGRADNVIGYYNIKYVHEYEGMNLEWRGKTLDAVIESRYITESQLLEIMKEDNYKIYISNAENIYYL
jgi:hypothetical protein